MKLEYEKPIKEMRDIFKIEKGKISEFLDKLAQKYTVFTPITYNGITGFKEMGDEIPKPGWNDRVMFDFYNTDKPPKEVFFPQMEIMLKYERENIKPQRYEGKPIALFGVRACDAKAILLLDKVFDGEKYTDTYWKARYNDAVIFVLACNVPLSTCFCNWVNCGPFNKEGADAFLVDIGDDLIVEPCTEKGVNVIREVSLQKVMEEDLIKGEEVKSHSESLLSKPIDLAGLKEKLIGLWDNPIWEEISQKCLGCAVCTYLCPTCHCFDIQDEGRGSKGVRIRIWDSCAFKLFTQEAAGTNPRPTTKERLRQRMMHKFNYFVENFGEFGCVGCGRCLRECPVNLDVRDIIQRVKNLKLT